MNLNQHGLILMANPSGSHFDSTICTPLVLTHSVESLGKPLRYSWPPFLYSKLFKFTKATDVLVCMQCLKFLKNESTHFSTRYIEEQDQNFVHLYEPCNLFKQEKTGCMERDSYNMDYYCNSNVDYADMCWYKNWNSKHQFSKWWCIKEKKEYLQTKREILSFFRHQNPSQLESMSLKNPNKSHHQTRDGWWSYEPNVH